jgi:hypothetical protein
MGETPRIWFDTEFIEDGRTIDLISIGLVRADGATYYAECEECDIRRASPWVQENALPHLRGPLKARSIIADEIRAFAGEKPEFWAYYADYDWVALCQLYGTMMDLPKGWPMYCRDLKQWCDTLGNPALPKQDTAEHHALADAQWNKAAWAFLLAKERELEAERNAVLEDAKRYRWLRDKSEPNNPDCTFYLSLGAAFKDVRFKPATVDAAIDAAIHALKT